MAVYAFFLSESISAQNTLKSIIQIKKVRDNMRLSTTYAIFSINNINIHLKKITALIITLTLLNACGGSKEDKPKPPEPPPAPTVVTSEKTHVTPAVPTTTPAKLKITARPKHLIDRFAVNSYNTCWIDNFQKDIFKAINIARAQVRKCGDVKLAAVGTVKWHEYLFVESAAHSLDMIDNNYFSHISSDGKDASARLTKEWYPVLVATGENLAKGQLSVKEVVDAWLTSPEHCKVIMNPNFEAMGAACLKSDDDVNYWTLLFAKAKPIPDGAPGSNAYADWH
jgi:uncharacterized protein YkwD